MSLYFENAVEKVTKQMQEEIIDIVREMDFLKSINAYQPIDYSTYLKVYSNTSIRKDAKAMGSLLQGTFPGLEGCIYNCHNNLLFSWKGFRVEIPPGNDVLFIHTDPCYYPESNMEKIEVLIEEVLPKLEKFCDGCRGAKIRQSCNNEFCYCDFDNLQKLYEEAKLQKEKDEVELA